MVNPGRTDDLNQNNQNVFHFRKKSLREKVCQFQHFLAAKNIYWKSVVCPKPDVSRTRSAAVQNLYCFLGRVSKPSQSFRIIKMINGLEHCEPSVLKCNLLLVMHSVFLICIVPAQGTSGSQCRNGQRLTRREAQKSDSKSIFSQAKTLSSISS